MEHSDLLQTISEVATAFAGFSGIVVALGGRTRGEWNAGDVSALGVLLACSLGVVFFAFLPALVLAAQVESVWAWRLSSLLFASYHLLVIAGAVWRRKNVQGSQDPLVWRALSSILGGLGVSLIVAQFLTGLGFLEPWLAFVYLANLLWLLLVATILFSLLVFDILKGR